MYDLVLREKTIRLHLKKTNHKKLNSWIQLR